MPANAADTKACLRAVHEASSSVSHMAGQARPLAAARRLNLADHDEVARATAMTLTWLARSVNEQGHMVRHLYGEHGNSDRGAALARTFHTAALRVEDAWRSVRVAAQQMSKDVQALHADTAAHRGSYTGLPRAAHYAEQHLSSLARGMQHGWQYGVRLEGHNEIAGEFGVMLADMGAALANIGALAAGSYELPIGNVTIREPVTRHARTVASRYAAASEACRRSHRALGGPAATLADDHARARTQARTGAR